MCSPISLVVADYRDALLEAVTDVAENSLFAFVDASDQASFEAARTDADTANGWLDACIEFRGPTSGRFELTLSEPLARHLCASFAGAEGPDEFGEADLFDFTGELANMMCGAWLTRACRWEAFSLTPPRVSRAPQHVASSGDASDRCYVSIDDALVQLEIHWEHPDSPSSGCADGR